MDGRAHLVAVTSSLVSRATGADATMRGFLSALGDGGVDDAEWPDRVGMALAGKPVGDWNDKTRRARDSWLQEAAAGFLRLVVLNFSGSTGHLAESPPPYMVTVTRRDGAKAFGVATTSGRDGRVVDNAVERMVRDMGRGQEPQHDDPRAHGHAQQEAALVTR